MPDAKFSIGTCFSWSWTASVFKGAFRCLQRHPLNEENAEIIWKTRHKTVRKTVLPRKFGGITVVWKDYTNTRFWRFFLRRSFAAREAVGYRTAEKLGIPVPRLLACGDTRRFFKLKSCFIVTEFMKNSQNGLVFCPGGTMAGEEGPRKAFCKQNLYNLAILHEAGFRHGTALPQNMLWSINRDSRMETAWIDLEKVRKFSGRRLRRHMKKDLRDFLGNLEFDPETTEQMVNYYNRVRRSIHPDAKPIDF